MGRTYEYAAVYIYEAKVARGYVLPPFLIAH